MEYFSTDNETFVLNDQTEETPSTSIGNSQHNFQDEHNSAKYLSKTNEASILNDLFEDAALIDDPFS